MAPTHRTRSAITRSLLVAVLLAAACCNRLSAPESPFVICDQSNDATPLPNAGRFGFFASEFYQGYAVHIDSLSAIFGARPAYALWFQWLDDPFPAAVVAANASRNIRTVISLNIESKTASPVRNDTLLKEIARGAWDSVLIAFAEASLASGVPLYLRFGYEMNGDWFPWGNKPVDFKAAWNRAHSIFKQARADNVRWVFSPNVVYGDMTVSQGIFAYYPGDPVVDVVGLDGYNYGDGFDRWHSWQTFREVFQKSLTGIASMGKSVWITETGCPTDPKRPAWLADLLAFMDENTCVEAVLWFNANKTGEPDFRLQSDGESLSLIRNWLGR